MDISREMNSRFAQYSRLLLRRRRLFYLVVGLPLLFSILFTAIAPPSFKAVAQLLPTSDTSNMGVVGILTGLFGSRGAASSDGAPSSFLYKDILNSQTVIESVLDDSVEYVDRKGKRRAGRMRKLIDCGSGTKGVEDFRRSNSVKMDLENGVITISTTAEDPQLAALVANTWIDKLDDFNRNIRVTQASENLKYLEKRLAQSKAELEQSRDSLVAFLSANRSYPASTNPRVENIVRDLTKQRDVKEQIYQLLSQEYEMARLTKQKTTPVVSILDRAMPPNEKAGPKRTTVFLFSFAFALVIFIIALAILEASDPTPSDMPVEWREIKAAFAADLRAVGSIFRGKR